MDENVSSPLLLLTANSFSRKVSPFHPLEWSVHRSNPLRACAGDYSGCEFKSAATLYVWKTVFPSTPLHPPAL